MRYLVTDDVPAKDWRGRERGIDGWRIISHLAEGCPPLHLFLLSHPHFGLIGDRGIDLKTTTYIIGL